MRATRSVVLALPPPLLLALGGPRREALAPIGFHDDDRPAGRLANGELTLALEIRRGLWVPNGPERPGTPMMAFAEPGDRARAIAPRDSFDARMTPPRAGTFIYHTHLMEIRQQQAGLYGAMIVLPPGVAFDAARDHVMMTSTARNASVLLNGSRSPASIEFEEGGTHRLRLINITTSSPGLRLSLLRADGTSMMWTREAKDGMDLLPNQRTTIKADQPVAMGETYDMLLTGLTPGEYRLELRTNALVLLSVQSIRVVPRQR